MEKIKSVWMNFEVYNKLEVPLSLKFLLWKCGYDSMFSIKQINQINIKEMEEFIEKHRNKILEGLLDDNNDIRVYKKLKTFKFLPGHKNILRDLSKSISVMQSELTLYGNGRTNTMQSMESFRNILSF